MNADLKPEIYKELSAFIFFPICVYLRKEIVFYNYNF